MNRWEQELADCFDNLDRFFASHAMDEERAFRLLSRLREERVGWRQLSNAVRDLLASDGCSPQHVEMQVRQVESRFRLWLGE